jgi:hypothetical protein
MTSAIKDGKLAAVMGYRPIDAGISITIAPTSYRHGDPFIRHRG